MVLNSCGRPTAAQRGPCTIPALKQYDIVCVDAGVAELREELR